METTLVIILRFRKNYAVCDTGMIFGRERRVNIGAHYISLITVPRLFIRVINSPFTLCFKLLIGWLWPRIQWAWWHQLIHSLETTLINLPISWIRENELMSSNLRKTSCSQAFSLSTFHADWRTTQILCTYITRVDLSFSPMNRPTGVFSQTKHDHYDGNYH